MPVVTCCVDSRSAVDPITSLDLRGDGAGATLQDRSLSIAEIAFFLQYSEPAAFPIVPALDRSDATGVQRDLTSRTKPTRFWSDMLRGPPTDISRQREPNLARQVYREITGVR